MADATKIEWTDATANAVNGCSVLSPGCTNCYAMRLAGTRMRDHPTRAGLTVPTKAGPVWTGETRFNEKALLAVLGWKRPRRIFWNAHGDLFHDSVPDEWIDRCFAMMALTPQHQHQVLTKRSARMREYVTAKAGWHLGREGVRRLGHLNDRGFTEAMARYSSGRVLGDFENAAVWPLPNVWLGVSVEDQTRADERIPDLLATPAAVRFLSVEPMLGAVDLRRIRNAAEPGGPLNSLTGYQALTPAGGDGVGYYLAEDGAPVPRIGWVICGGESGPNARPMHPDWARSLRDHCAAAGVPFLFKQWGEWLPSDEIADRSRGWRVFGDQGFSNVGKARAGRLLDGVTHDGFPA